MKNIRWPDDSWPVLRGRHGGFAHHWQLFYPSAVAVFLLLLGSPTSAQLAPATNLRVLEDLQVTNLAYARAPIDNPLKGIEPNTSHSPSARAAFPHSLLFANNSLRATVVASNTYDWTAFETTIAAATNDGSQLVARFDLDQPGETTRIPQYLLDGGLWTLRYDGTSLFPDYTNASLRACLTNFIAAYGAKYDGDPRIAFVEMGLVGPWGEWDTGNWTAQLLPHWVPLETEAEILLAYTKAFTRTKLLVRYPAGPSNNNGDIATYRNDNLPVGYYDDAFCTKTVPDNFWPARGEPGWYYQMNMMHIAGATNHWKQWPYGGEAFYNKGACIFSNPPCVTGVQTWSNCVYTTHATFMHIPSVFYTNAYYHGTNALWGAYILGYELWAQQFSAWTDGGNLACQLIMTNTGVAPFYYDWQIELQALTNGVTAQTWRPAWKLSRVIPGEGSVAFVHTLSNAPPRPFTMVMRAINPMPGGKQLRFANANQNATRINWLTLGVVR